MNILLHGGHWTRCRFRSGWWTCAALPGRRYRSSEDLHRGLRQAGWVLQGLWAFRVVPAPGDKDVYPAPGVFYHDEWHGRGE